MKLKKSLPVAKFKNVLVVLGTGKTTVSRLIIRALFETGLRVGSCKLRGSVSNRDQDEMRSAAACFAVDSSDYGFPYTHNCSNPELFGLFNALQVSGYDIEVAREIPSKSSEN